MLFSGVLRDGTGTPLPGLAVSVSGPATFQSISTAADGSFSLNVPPDTYNLAVNSNGCGNNPSNGPFCLFSHSAASITLNTDRVQDLTLPTVVLEATVLDPLGNPVPNALVRTETSSAPSFELFPGARASANAIGRAMTDASGIARVVLLPHESVTVEASPPPESGYSSTRVYGVPVLSNTSVTVRLPATVRFSGVLRDGTGTPLPGLAVSVSGPATFQSISTAADGSFSLNVPPDTYNLAVNSNGCGNNPSNGPFCLFSHSAASITLNTDRVQDLTLPTVVLEATVLDPLGNPVPNALVRTETSSAPSFELFPGARASANAIGRAMTDASGIARVVLLPHESVTVEASPPPESPFATFRVQNVNVPSDVIQVLALQFVHAPPSTTATVTPQPNAQGVYPGPVMVSLSAIATSGFTVANTYYTIDGGAKQTYTEPFEVLGGGSHLVKYWSVDNIGVQETPKPLSIQIDELRITTDSLLETGTIGVPYEADLKAAGGTEPYTWSIAAGDLPPGLDIEENTGRIYGTPTTAGTFDFTVQVRDSTNVVSSKKFGMSPPPSDGKAGEDYRQPIYIEPPESGGGTPPVCSTYTVVDGALPDGLKLDETTGEVSGTPTNGGTYTFVIGCTVTTGQTATKEFTITIENPLPAITSLDPSSVRATTGAFDLTVNGTKFVKDSVVYWNGASRPTTYISANRLTAQIAADDIASEGTASVTVVNPEPAGGTSNAATFTILPANRPPVAVAGDDQTVNEGATVNLDGSGSSDPDGDTLSYGWSVVSCSGLVITPSPTSAAILSFDVADNGICTLQLEVSDGKDETDTDEVIVTVRNVAPTVGAPILEPEPSDEGSGAAVSATFDDPGAADGPFACTVNYGDGSGSVPGTVNGTTCTGPEHTYADNGSYQVTVSVTDKDGENDSNSVTHTVDNAVPSVDVPVVTPSPSDEGSAVSASADFRDPGVNDAPFTCTVDYGDGSSTQPGIIDGMTCTGPAHTYADNGSYQVTVSVADKDRGTGSNLTMQTVENVAPTVGPITAPLEPVLVNTAIDAAASFTDPGVRDTHTAVWDWGDGATSTGSVTEANGSGSTNGNHVYTAAGVYTLTLTVTDKDGGTGQTIYRYVVVYDPEGGFVTGGGWINSPAGAYAADPSLVGRANFGFVSKYQRGATTPTGQTEFQFKVASLNFHSSTYSWLVIAGAKAQYKGEGTINGTGVYGFMLTAIDGQETGGGGVDKFRIKIWEKASGNVVYDNQMDAADDAEPTTTLGGGNIVIHSGR